MIFVPSGFVGGGVGRLWISRRWWGTGIGRCARCWAARRSVRSRALRVVENSCLLWAFPVKLFGDAGDEAREPSGETSITAGSATATANIAVAERIPASSRSACSRLSWLSSFVCGSSASGSMSPGVLCVQPGAGLGVKVDPDKLARYRTDR